ncbi:MULTISPECIES: CPBP family intramembrane glutamic endopeptidase [unclassified Gemella]|uniref:CPBP family intramembrane glutamic endopeptidase n=1 Tax=unclassified Gemella TaxID=2624949 RepID=UPI001C057F76|nr:MULTISPECIES: type II CAAX endopeptidase family protein [unclassified Gemella]MBU0278097.1 CPBP family intramembrane metalloprotease [Gemella sp. zg-1178]QWQ38377.1 CPBP family intramembrane metalloprotease [Gemella sp. zg-570]
MKLNFKNGKILPVLVFVGIYLLSLIVLPYSSVKYFKINNTEMIYNLMLLYNFLAAVIIIFFTSKYKINSIEKEGSKYNILMSIFFSILGFLAMYLLQICIGILLQIFSKIFGFEVASQNTADIVKIIKKIPIFSIYVLILAPILEELVFRKIIFGYLYDILYSKYEWIRFLFAAVLSGILFAIPHDGFSPVMLLYIALSILFCFLYKITGRISVSIIAHSLMNLVVVLAQIYLIK